MNERDPAEGLQTPDQALAGHEERERWREARRRRLIAKSLREILTALNSNQPLDAIPDLIFAKAQQLLDAQAVGICRLESEADRWAVKATRCSLVPHVAGSNLPTGQSTLRLAILSPWPLIGSSASAARPQAAMYRITREARYNVRRHTSASQALVSLPWAPGMVRLEVMDDGFGFDPASLAPDETGLRIMQERTAGIEAALEIEGQPGQGTHVRADWPGRLGGSR